MTDTEQLPREDAAERYLLGCLVAFPDRAGELFEVLKATDFVDQEHRKIFAAAARQHAAGGIDPVLLGTETGTASILFGLGVDPHNAPATTVHIPVEAAKVIECRKKRERFDALQSLASHALNGYSSERIDLEIKSLQYDWQRERESTGQPEQFTLPDLRRQYPTLNPPVVDGLLREGETVNVIANSKAGKSWLGYGLAWSIITGESWLGQFTDDAG